MIELPEIAGPSRAIPPSEQQLYDLFREELDRPLVAWLLGLLVTYTGMDSRIDGEKW